MSPNGGQTSIDWNKEGEVLTRFLRELGEAPALPSAGSEQLHRHAERIVHLQDLLGLISTLPPARRPPVKQWDDMLSPLWRSLFAKGDDIDRYVLADAWRTVLYEAGEMERYARACTAVASSARNSNRFQEALDCCREGREALGDLSSGALVNLINAEGITHALKRDFEAAEAAFLEALNLAERIPEKELTSYSGQKREDLRAQEYLNILGTRLQRGLYGPPSERGSWSASGRELLSRLEGMSLSDGFRRMIEVDRATIALMEERFEEAKALLTVQLQDPALNGPYRYSLRPTVCRLLSLSASLEGDWPMAYLYIRVALKEGVNHSFPAEDQLVLDQVIEILRGLHKMNDVGSQRSLVNDLAHLLEDKEWYTGGSHSRGVSSLAVSLGGTLKDGKGWDLDLETLEMAGLLHDIGKLRIPWSLLNKIAPITPRERTILEDHTSHGGDILRQTGLPSLASIVEQHHEAMDGSGYPGGVTPAPMAAILAVCDVYEALVTPNRRYKDPKSRREALEMISSEAGPRFHPEVVEALVTSFNSGKT